MNEQEPETDPTVDPDGLALTAQEAVTKLSAAAGHPLVATKKGGGGGGAAVGIVVAVALLALGLLGAFWLRRSQSAAVTREEGVTPRQTGDPEAPAP